MLDIRWTRGCNKGTYYPKNTVQLGDPAPANKIAKLRKDHLGNIQSLLSYIHRENDGEVYEKAYALDTALKDHKKIRIWISMPKEKPETILRKYTAEVLSDPRFKDFVESMSKDVQKEANPIVREDKLQTSKTGSPVA